MPKYVMLMKLTTKGLAELKDAPARMQQGIKMAEAAGAKVESLHVTMGPYDYIAVAEGPSDEAAAMVAMGLGMQGHVTTETLRAFTPEEFAGLVGKLG